MKIEITYVFHNCFILQIPRAEGIQSFLFDYPSDKFLTNPMKTAVISKIRDTDLYVFSSHNHQDHFNRNVRDLDGCVKRITYILSKDIVKKNRQFKEMKNSHSIEPDGKYQINDLEIQSFLSNDEGVAFLIKVADANGTDLSVYFGGDLANWDWEDLSKKERLFLVDYFGEVLAKLNSQTIQIAFSNTDARLPNWAGAAQFIETIRPRLFVPMHAFGDTTTIARFLNEHCYPGTEVFKYNQTGDILVFEV